MNVKFNIEKLFDIYNDIFYYHSRSAINTVSEELIKYRNTDKNKIQVLKQKTETLEN